METNSNIRNFTSGMDSKYISKKMGGVSIGENVFFNNACSITAREKVIIGRNCIIGENVKFYDHNHNYRDVDKFIFEQGYCKAEIVIEEDCWIGSNVTILKGVHIGKHCVIGAGVIVYKDVPENSVLICKQNIVTAFRKQ